MTDSQWDSTGRLSPWAVDADSEGDRPFSRRSLMVGVFDPETLLARVPGDEVDALLNMVAD